MDKLKKKRSNDPLGIIYRTRDRALQRVVETFLKSGTPNDDGAELEKALDTLTVAHVAATFDWASKQW
jgi:hypothetical protein